MIHLCCYPLEAKCVFYVSNSSAKLELSFVIDNLTCQINTSYTIPKNKSPARSEGIYERIETNQNWNNAANSSRWLVTS